MTPETLPPAHRDQDGSHGIITIRSGLLREEDVAQAQRQDGSALQVVLRTHSILFHGQRYSERAVVLALLRQIKAQSLTDGKTERLKLRGARN